MKYFKLFLISVVVFGVMLFCISLLFPSTTIVSRAVNIMARKDSMTNELPAFYQAAFQQHGVAPLKQTDYKSDISVKTSDTLLVVSPFAAHIQQGVAVYRLASDSTTVQVFYKIQVPWYKFWKKFGLMLNETKYGPSLDSATKRIAEKF